MRFTIDFQPHEIPAIFAQLARLASGDISAFVDAQSAPGEASEASEDDAPEAPAHVRGNTVAEAALRPHEKRKAGRPSAADKASRAAANTSPVSMTAPVVPMPSAPVVATPAPAAPAAPVSVPPPAPVAPVAAPAPSQAPVSIDQVYQAMARADGRDASSDQFAGVLSALGATTARSLTPDKYPAAIAAFDALNA